MGCDCCDEPICELPEIVCDSVSAIKTKDGFSPFHGPSDYYSHETLIGTSCVGSDSFSGAVGQYSVWKTNTTVYTGCGSNSGTITAVLDYGSPFNTCVSCSGSMTSGCVCSGNCASCSSFNFVTRDSTLSNEYTTAELKTNTIAALPAYDNDFNDTCSSFLDLDAHEVTCSIRRFKYKVRHFPTASCYLKVWLRLRFRPEGTSGGSDVLTDVDPYEWTGDPTDGSLCLTDATKSPGHADNQLESDVSDEIVEPDSDGTTSIEIKKWTCLEGYEPDDPNDDGTRPSPDVNPNGWPKPA